MDTVIGNAVTRSFTVECDLGDNRLSPFPQERRQGPVVRLVRLGRSTHLHRPGRSLDLL